MENQKKKKTELVTFRFEKEMLENLRKGAETKQISLNALMSQIVKQYFDWYSKAPDIGIIPIEDILLKLILKDFSKSELQKIAHNWTKNYSEGAMLSSNMENTLESLLETLENWGRIAGLGFTKHETSKSIILTFRHNCGKNFSILCSEMFLSLTKGFSNKVNVKSTIQSFGITISKK